MKTVKNSGSKLPRCRSRWVAAIAVSLLGLASGAALSGPSAPSRRAHVYPSAETLPANQLKFYLHFSEPMREGVFLAHCRLLDARGEPVHDPFRETELWTEDHRRLTLWLHPGRQKTGVNLNAEFGPVLEPGRSYTLVISGEWPTARETPLGAELRKEFRTAPRVTRQLEATEWRLELPPAGTTQPLTVRFPAPLDQALLARCLRVLDPLGGAVKGTFEIGAEERSWHFTPADPWKPEEHRLAAESLLEDLAGNSLARPFEVDLEAPPPRAAPRVVTLPFQPRAVRR